MLISYAYYHKNNLILFNACLYLGYIRITLTFIIQEKGIVEAWNIEEHFHHQWTSMVPVEMEFDRQLQQPRTLQLLWIYSNPLVYGLWFQCLWMFLPVKEKHGNTSEKLWLNAVLSDSTSFLDLISEQFTETIF